MATEDVKQETIERPLDECECDCCGQPMRVGDPIFVSLERGTAYCCLGCAEHDDFDRGYGPVCPGVSRW